MDEGTLRTVAAAQAAAARPAARGVGASGVLGSAGLHPIGAKRCATWTTMIREGDLTVARSRAAGAGYPRGLAHMRRRLDTDGGGGGGSAGGGSPPTT